MLGTKGCSKCGTVAAYLRKGTDIVYTMNQSRKVGAYYEGRKGPGVRFLDLDNPDAQEPTDSGHTGESSPSSSRSTSPAKTTESDGESATPAALRIQPLLGWERLCRRMGL